ncbi:Uncharacterised protein [Bordetella pertussis]|nr:Uncharacterised protein [Bordetella pertussis]
MAAHVALPCTATCSACASSVASKYSATRRASCSSRAGARSAACSPRSARARNSMSLTSVLRSSSSSRLEVSASRSSSAERGDDSVTWAPLIRVARGVRSSCATSALKPSIFWYASCRRSRVRLNEATRSLNSRSMPTTGRRTSRCSGWMLAAWPESRRTGASVRRTAQAASTTVAPIHSAQISSNAVP